MDLLHALLVLAIYLIPFVAIGIVGRKIFDRLMTDRHLSDIHEQAGEGRRKQAGFLLGAWYRRD